MNSFESRINYGLCDKNFKEQPYCNQMSGLLNKNGRFCDVCKHRWHIVDNLIIQLKPVLKEEEIEINSKWLDMTTKNIITLVDIKTVREEGWYSNSYKFEYLDDDGSKHYRILVDNSNHASLMSTSSNVYPIVKELQ